MTNPNHQEQYTWLAQSPEKPEDYLPPAYYDHLLKDYAFGGKTDLEILDDYLDTVPPTARILELGCGSGRATERIVGKLGQAQSIDLVDLSEDMVAYTGDRFKDQPNVTAHQSDSVNFLAGDREYDAVVSLWNLSHSVHQHMLRLGREEGAQYVGEVLDDFIVNKLASNGSMHIVHYDIQSPEQRLINPWRLSLWDEADPSYDATGQSPSKELLDEVLGRLQDAGVIEYECVHLEGDPIEYPNAEVALETFLNFHMEGHFNDRPELPDVIDSLLNGFQEYTDEDGVVRIAPGTFVYEVVRK